MNFIAIVVAALMPTVIGFIWYHPKVFGNLWMNAAGMTDEKIRSGNMPVIFGVSFLLSVMLAVVMNSIAYHDSFVEGALYYITNRTMQPEAGSEAAKWLEYYKTTLAASNHTFQHGAFHGFFLGGVFFALPIMATNALFERKSFKYIAVNAGYWMVTLGLMGGLLAAWH